MSLFYYIKEEKEDFIARVYREKDCIGFLKAKKAKRGCCSILCIWVDLAERRKGVGSKLIKHFIQFVKEKNIFLVYLNLYPQELENNEICLNKKFNNEQELYECFENLVLFFENNNFIPEKTNQINVIFNSILSTYCNINKIIYSYRIN